MKKNLSTANKLFMKLWFLTFLFLGACIPINNKIKVNFAESNIVIHVNHAPSLPSSLACTSGPLGSSTGNTCTLTAANPVDSDSGDTVTYFDDSSTCSTVLVNSSTGNAIFTSPAKGGTCVVKVKAYDGHLYSSTITSATITGANNAPTIAALLSCLTSPSAASTGNTCLLTSVVALDIDGDSFTYVDSESTCSTVVVNSLTGDATFTAPTKGATCLVKIKAYDGSSYSGTVTSATITGANHTPIATAQSKNVNYNTPTAITLLGNDADGDSQTYTVVAGPSHGTLSGIAPNLTYTPTAVYVGADSFTFKVNDGTVDSSAATVAITVRAMLSLYFNNGCPNSPPNANWATLENWWLDNSCATQATSIPENGNFVYLIGSTAPGTGPAALLTLAGFNSSDLNSILDNVSGIVTGNIIIYPGGTLVVGVLGDNGSYPQSWYGTDNSSAMFQGSASNFGTVAGSATFNGTSSNAGTVSGTIHGGPGNSNVVSDLYLSAIGNNGTGLPNSAANPYLTIQAAYNGISNPQLTTPLTIHLGAGNFGNLNLAANFGQYTTWAGVDNIGSSIIGNVVGDGTNWVNAVNIDLEVASGSKVVFGDISSNATDSTEQYNNGGNITLSAGAQAGNISANGIGGGNCSQGGTGGTIVIRGAVGLISTNGGNSCGSSDTLAGNGGNVTVSGSATSIEAIGGGSMAYGGNGGNIFVSGTVTSIAADGGYGAQIGGAGGNISISGTATTLSTQGGAGMGYGAYSLGGNGGTVAVSGTTSTINVSGGYADSQYAGRYGTEYAQGGSFGAVIITGGGHTGAITAVAGAVQAWGSITLNDVPSDGDTLTVGDGSSTITFEFQSSGGVTNGNTVVQSIPSYPNDTASNLESALNNLDVRSSRIGNQLFLQNRSSGAQGNVPITTTSGVIDVNGMTGGN